MKKNNLQLLAMVGIFSLVSGLLLIIATKFMPFFSNETVYMCKNMVASVSFRQIPHYFSSSLLYIGALYGTYVFAHVGAALYQYKKLIIKFGEHSHIKRSKKITELRGKYPFLPMIHIVSSKNSTAFSLGFIRRNIYVSTHLINSMSYKELEAVVLHEYKHVRDFDSLKLFIAFFIETSLSFIPSMRELTISMRINREIEADGFAVSMQKTNIHVLSSIKKFLSFDHVYQQHFIPRFAPGDLFDARIASLIRENNTYKKSASIYRFLVSTFSFLIIIYLALTPVHAAEVLIDGKASVMTCAETSPQCLAVCQASASYLISK